MINFLLFKLMLIMLRAILSYNKQQNVVKCNLQENKSINVRKIDQNVLFNKQFRMYRFTM